jgi:hypothetical protein
LEVSETIEGASGRRVETNLLMRWCLS